MVLELKTVSLPKIQPKLGRQRHGWVSCSEYTTYAWALVLLVIVLVTIIASLVALLFVYYINKRKTAELRRRLAYSHATDSSNVSQVVAPGANKSKRIHTQE